MRQDLSTTSYALLGLLVFDGAESPGLTGYELKQRADRTLRFYWVAPAMSQVYSELARLADLGLVARALGGAAGRRDRRYRITADGLTRLRRWQADSAPEFPILKHPVALRLLMGHLAAPEQLTKMLVDYRAALAERRAELTTVRTLLGERAEVVYPAMVADWGLAYYDAEDAIVTDLVARLTQDSRSTQS
ncbi:MAG: PadR family transcriptional regulator [Microlunatus sp.]|nr:PadR family transcriptional regulator [Microlunatus sp.]MDN5770554.1 PadR family transcriptional regulator [Microlunatus sp.]